MTTSENATSAATRTAPPASLTTTLDFSFSKLTVLDDILDEEPREGFCRHTVPEDAPPPGPITTLKLNNNAFTTLNKFSQFLERLLWEPAKLSFIDLSFNGFQEIPSQLQELPNLSVLYLHGNEIQRLKEIHKLAPLKQLVSLSLHGNDIESKEGYRYSILCRLPNLRKLDFTTVIPSDRDKAIRWQAQQEKRRAAAANA